MAFQNAPFPARDPINAQNGLVSDPWREWFTQLTADVSSSPSRLGVSVSLEPQAASIGSTPLNLGSLASGLYRATYYARVTTPATTSSSLAVSIGATDGVPYLFTGSAMTGNTTATVGSDSWLLKVDQGTPLVYSTTYSSVGATPMQYVLSIVTERLDA